jgi:hypothetical protein
LRNRDRIEYPISATHRRRDPEDRGSREGILAALLEYGFTGGLDRVASADSFIPLSDAALEVLLSEDAIEAAAMKLVGSAQRPESLLRVRCLSMLVMAGGVVPEVGA